MESPLLHAAVLGLIQGLTEFLPISSSGHLALAQQLIPGFDQPGVLLDVLLHFGTLLAVIVYFRKDIIKLALAAVRAGVAAINNNPAPEKDRNAMKLLAGILIAQIPTGIIGLALQHRVEFIFKSAAGVGAFLILTALILVAGEKWAKAEPPNQHPPAGPDDPDSENDDVGNASPQNPGGPGPGQQAADTAPPGMAAALLVGIVQGISVFPGISRSGSTISAARILGVGPSEAARFSFLASLPAIAGATLITAIKEREAIADFSGDMALAYVAGPLVAGVVGYFAIEAVMRLLKRGRLVWFAPYCALAGALAVAYGLFLP